MLVNLKNLEKSEKCKTLKISKKIHHKQRFNYLVFFKPDRPVFNHLNVSFIYKKITTLKPFFLKKVDFCIFNPKSFEVDKTVQKLCYTFAHYNAHI